MKRIFCCFFWLLVAVTGFCQTDVPALPQAMFSSSSPDCLGQMTIFADHSTNTYPSYGYITTWIWDTGDGTPIDTIEFPACPDICHTYAEAGTYLVTETVIDNYGNSASHSETVVILDNPVAFFQFANACENQEVLFTDLSITSNGTITTWAWNFGDPASGLLNTSALQNPSHLFSTIGSYQVTSTVTNNNGCNHDTTLTVVISQMTVGGSVSGSDTITLGETTGTMVLSGHTGNVNAWQRRYNGGSYLNISGTQGLTSYSETPEYSGFWDYRAVIQSGMCSVQYATPATIIVNTPAGLYKTWTGTISEDWNEPGNWTPGGVPASKDNIVIPVSAPQMPKIMTNGLSCDDVIVHHGATLNIEPGYTLTITGEFILE